MRFLRENSISYEILMNLKDLGSDFAYVAFVHPPRSLRDSVYHFDKRMNGRTKVKRISQLKKQGLLEEYKKDGERYMKLSEKGKIEIARYKLKQKTTRQWDKRWRDVFFDI